MKNFKFKKYYGQNFLVDKNVVRKIVDDIDVKDKSLVIEIGCGDGKLTSVLCEKFDWVLGYEIDDDLRDVLSKNLSKYSNYNLIFGDFLNRNVEKDISFDYSHLYVIANLPYYITTAIIDKMIDSKLVFEVMRFMVQKEVGERICAKAGTKDYNALTVYLNYKYDVKKEFVVKRDCFFPKPNVDSAIISFYKKKNSFFVRNEDFFYKLVRDSFRFKRKTLRNNLKEYDLDTILEVLGEYGLDLSVRAEQVSIEIFCEISNKLSI